jgi:hypothetical protein
MSGSDLKSYEFINSFKESHKYLSPNVKFTPHYALWFCGYCKLKNYQVNNDHCVSGGRYCAPDPDGNGPLLGKDVVLEDLR